jgi:putative methyltransferase (TIGR04325 family)
MLRRLLGNTIAGLAKDVHGFRARSRTFRTWDEAARQSTYEDGSLTEFRARKAERVFREGYYRQISTPGLNLLRLCAFHVVSRRGGVDIVDFGGSFGEVGLQLVEDEWLPNLTYTVCESGAVARRAQQIPLPDSIGFVDSLDGLGRACDIFFTSGTLAYVGNHEDVLRAAMTLRPYFIILVRNSFSDRPIIRLQASRLFDNGPPLQPEGDFVDRTVHYPHHTLVLADTIALLEGGGYHLLSRFPENSGVHPYGDEVFGMDLVFVEKAAAAPGASARSGSHR